MCFEDKVAGHEFSRPNSHIFLLVVANDCSFAVGMTMTQWSDNAMRMMTQHCIVKNGRQYKSLRLPAATEEIMPDLQWGRIDQLFTPAYWKSQTWLQEETIASHRFGKTLHEEVVACLLGGYGIPSEIAFAAFIRLRDDGLIEDSKVTEVTIRNALTTPFTIKGRECRYRFARQKSRYIATALWRLSNEIPTQTDHKSFRTWLMAMDGVGPKIASWITRNWLDSDAVAIIDIHLHRAGLLTGFFPQYLSVARDYFALEQLYLEFAGSIGVRASTLDALMWRQMKILAGIPLRELEKTCKLSSYRSTGRIVLCPVPAAGAEEVHQTIS